MDTDKDGQISFEEFYNHHLKLNGLKIITEDLVERINHGLF